MKEKPLTISIAAKKAQIGVETIRYYQRIGLIKEPVKPKSGYRVYSEQSITQLLSIRQLKTLGFSLSEISMLLTSGNEKYHKTIELASSKLNQVKRKINDLTFIAKSLEKLIKTSEEDSLLQKKL